MKELYKIQLKDELRFEAQVKAGNASGVGCTTNQARENASDKSEFYRNNRDKLLSDSRKEQERLQKLIDE